MAVLPCNVLQTTIAETHRPDCENQFPQCRPLTQNAAHDIFEYIFVNPMSRRLGYGSRLLEVVRNTTGNPGRALEPISPLGRQFFASNPGLKQIAPDEIDANGDRLFFDDECFLRAVPGAERFQLDTLAPVAASGVIVGSKSNGAELADPAIGADALAARIRFV